MSMAAILAQPSHAPWREYGLTISLVDRAVALGWLRERVQVIDEDLGKSGTSAQQRLGLQQLSAEIGLRA